MALGVSIFCSSYFSLLSLEAFRNHGWRTVPSRKENSPEELQNLGFASTSALIRWERGVTVFPLSEIGRLHQAPGWRSDRRHSLVTHPEPRAREVLEGSKDHISPPNKDQVVDLQTNFIIICLRDRVKGKEGSEGWCFRLPRWLPTTSHQLFP